MNLKFINFAVFLNVFLILTNTKASVAANFFVSPKETIIRKESFSTPLTAERNWEIVDFDFTTLNVGNGDINVYWKDNLPSNPSTEGDKYSVGFQYAENNSVCWNGGNVRNPNNIVDKDINASCPSSHANEVKEDALIKTFIRPRSYYTLNQDRGFGGIDPIGIGLEFPGNNVHTYRMTLSLQDPNTITASTFFLNSGTWQEMTVYNLNQTQQDLLGVREINPNLPLFMTYSDELATIEGLEIQFRRSGTSIEELLITQAINPSLATTQSVPESSNIFSLFNIGVLSLGLVSKSIIKK